jgi:O-antigen/teichoic acid export membrane protein
VPAATTPAPERAATEGGAFPGLAAIPETHTRKAASDAAIYTGATYGAQLLLFFAGIVQKGLLGPTNAGYWALMGTFMTFFSFFSLGAYEGVTRQIPAHRGRGDMAAAGRVSDSAMTFTVVSQAVFGTLVATIALAFGAPWATPVRWGLVIIGLTGPLRLLADCHKEILTSIKRFDAAGRVVVLQAVLALTVQTVFVIFLGYYGMFLGMVLQLVAGLLLWNRMGLTSIRRPAFRWRIERSALRETISFGLPFFVYAQIYLVFLSVDNLLVFKFLGAKPLGYYALACSVTSYLLYLPMTISAVLLPRMIERFSSNGDRRSIGTYAIQVQRIFTHVLLPPAIAASFFLLPVLVREALPAFKPAIPVIQVMVVGSFFISMVNVPAKALMTVGLRWSVTALMVASFIVNASANWIALGPLHLDVTAAAYATSLSYLTLFLSVTIYSLAKTDRGNEIARHVGEQVLAGAYLFAVIWAVEKFVGSGAGSAVHDIGFGLLKLALSMLLVSPLFIIDQRRHRTLSTLGGMVRSGVGSARAALRRRVTIGRADT